ncbi:hypothetical protein BI49514_02086 [Brevibacterium iodinum ATCC 49514]|uniref:Uncharacterized protein n=1 Tax=Brevibacterium iodinum ATCC 49514 TaxID=1255616 RepID=A0A2H1JK96_9MICO|nr:hypothetical protein BI49514_02086 [Brevibacterium iodinum ATCC 49514]
MSLGFPRLGAPASGVTADCIQNVLHTILNTRIGECTSLCGISRFAVSRGPLRRAACPSSWYRTCSGRLISVLISIDVATGTISLLSLNCSRTEMCGADGVLSVGRFVRHHVFARRRVSAFRAPHDFPRRSSDDFRPALSSARSKPRLPTISSETETSHQSPHPHHEFRALGSPTVFRWTCVQDSVHPAGKPDPAMGSTITIAAAVIS